jgi:pyrrolidone-carboxylate peptidase
MQKVGRYVLVTLVLVAVAAVLGWKLGRASGRQEMMVEAVQQNHGHYRITDPVGNTSFEWGPGPK